MNTARDFFSLNSDFLLWFINHFSFVAYILIFTSFPVTLPGLKILSRGQTCCWNTEFYPWKSSRNFWKV